MKTQNLIAKAEVHINASKNEVWDALVNPKTIEKYMMGAKVSSNWKEGGAIIWKGSYKGKAYEDKGIIVKLDPEKILSYTHYSPLTGLPDTPDNYHTVTTELSEGKNDTIVTLKQDKNTSEDDRKHSEENWTNMLTSLKKIVEEKK